MPRFALAGVGLRVVVDVGAWVVELESLFFFQNFQLDDDVVVDRSFGNCFGVGAGVVVEVVVLEASIKVPSSGEAPSLSFLFFQNFHPASVSSKEKINIQIF